MVPAPVLYAEDEDNDVFLMQRAFRKGRITNPLQVVNDGAQAIEYLAGSGQFADRTRFPLPCLVLLDLNLPRKSGLEVLKWVREQPHLKSMLVVLLTSSTQQRDIGSAHTLGANGYLVKPPSPDKLLELVATLRDTCLLPGATGQSGWLEIKGNVRPPAANEPS